MSRRRLRLMHLALVESGQSHSRPSRHPGRRSTVLLTHRMLPRRHPRLRRAATAIPPSPAISSDRPNRRAFAAHCHADRILLVSVELCVLQRPESSRDRPHFIPCGDVQEPDLAVRGGRQDVIGIAPVRANDDHGTAASPSTFPGPRMTCPIAESCHSRPRDQSASVARERRDLDRAGRMKRLREDAASLPIDEQPAPARRRRLLVEQRYQDLTAGKPGLLRADPATTVDTAAPAETGRRARPSHASIARRSRSPPPRRCS